MRCGGWRRARAALVVAALGVAATPCLATTPESLFEQGNNLYEEGRFEEGAKFYERILGYGVRDPRAHYNLANAYFKMGRLGPAILNYERALRIDPADTEARDNLEFARGRIRDRTPAPELPYPVAMVTGFLGRQSLDLLTGVFLLLYVLTCGMIGAIPLLRAPGWRRALGYAALVTGLGAGMAGGGMAYGIDRATAPRAIVMQDRADVLSGPAEDNTVLFTVHEGTRLEVHNARDGWYQVSLPNALSGWVRAGQVERV